MLNFLKMPCNLSIAKVSPLACLAFAAACLLLPDAVHAGKDEYKYEYRQGDCKYSYKDTKHGYKEEYKCKGYAFDRPKYKYEVKEGGCKYKYYETAKGYKEEYKCKKGKKSKLHNAGYWPKSQKRGPQVATSAPFGLDLGNCNRRLIGGLLGGAAGGLAGSTIGDGTGQVAATAGGVFLGLLVGSEIGRYMDEADRGCAGQALEHAPNNETVVWQNPANGGQYQMTPTSGFTNEPSGNCREYQTVATVGGQTQELTGTACRQPDGTWELQN